MRKIGLLIFTLLSTLTYSQNLIIDDSIKLTKGVYKDINEIKHNNPSIALTSQIDSTDLEYGFVYKVGSLKKYSLIDFKQNPNIAGFCDGNSIFINLGTGYYKAQYIGRYIIFEARNEDLKTPSAPVTIVTAGVVAYQIYKSYIKTFIALDLNTGMFFEVSENNVKSIIENDPLIYNDYKISIDVNKNYSFLVRYSISHKNELINSNIYFSDTVSKFDSYCNNLIKIIQQDPNFFDYVIHTERFLNRKIRIKGIMTKNKFVESNNEFGNRIGTWIFYNKDGSISDIVNYNFLEKTIETKKAP